MNTQHFTIPQQSEVALLLGRVGVSPFNISFVGTTGILIHSAGLTVEERNQARAICACWLRTTHFDRTGEMVE